MALYVKTNVSSLNARRNLEKSGAALDTAFKRLASGLRISSAKDDAAGLQISDRLTSQINGLSQGNRNAQDGISFCQTAEGALDEMTNMYQRIRTLALQSANGTNSAQDRAAIQEEVSQLCQEITRIGEDTTFGGEHILNKDLTAPTEFQVGANANETISIDLTSGFRINDVFEKLYNEGDSQMQTLLLSGGFARKVDCSQNGNAFSVTADYFASRGEYTVEVKSLASQTVFQKSIQYLEKDDEGLYIWDQEITYESGALTFELGPGSDAKTFTVQVNEGDTIFDIQRNINFAAGSSLTAHFSKHNDLYSYDLQGKINAFFYTPKGSAYAPPLSITAAGDERLNAFNCSIEPESRINNRDAQGWYLYRKGQDTVIEIDGVSLTDSYGNTFYDEEKGLHITANSVSGPITLTVDPETMFLVDTPETAQSTLATVDKFISTIDSKRAELGAVQNRLESSIRNQSNVAENISAARSRIRDADFAAETASMNQQNILQQASQSILSQANQRQQNVLSLLQ